MTKFCIIINNFFYFILDFIFMQFKPHLKFFYILNIKTTYDLIKRFFINYNFKSFLKTIFGNIFVFFDHKFEINKKIH